MPAKDATLSQIAMEFKGLPAFEDGALMTEFAHEIYREDIKGLKGVYCLPDGKTWACRFSIQSVRRVVAFATDERLGDLCRFHDQFVHRFWKYRAKLRVPTQDYIFQEEDAKFDVGQFPIQYPDAEACLQRIEKHFLAIGVWHTPEEVVDQETGRVIRKRRKNTIADDIFEMKKFVNQCFRDIEKMHNDLLSVINTQERTIKALADQLNAK